MVHDDHVGEREWLAQAGFVKRKPRMNKFIPLIDVLLHSTRNVLPRQFLKFGT
jgi:hypothetical protein